MRLYAFLLATAVLSAPAAAADNGPRLVPNRSGPMNVPPFAWTGLYQNPIGSCTAQFITDDFLLTAAHCVRDRFTGEYYDQANNFAGTFFLLQWQNNAWAELYHPTCAITYDGWVVHPKTGESAQPDATWSNETSLAYVQSWQWDFALVKVDHRSVSGHYVYDFQHAFNYGAGIGYPAAPLGEPALLEADPGDILKNTDLATMQLFTNTLLLWTGNLTFTEGASGGAWVSDFNQEGGVGAAPKDGTDILIGLNSFGNPNKPGAMFGPSIFTEKFDELLKVANTVCK